MTIAKTRLKAVIDDPFAGHVSIGRRLTAWHNKLGVKIAYSGDVIMTLTPAKLTLTPTKLMGKTAFYSAIGQAIGVAGLGAIELSTRKGRLVAKYRDATHIGAADGTLTIGLSP